MKFGENVSIDGTSKSTHAKPCLPFFVVAGLGQGGFALVLKVVNDNGTEYAMKVIAKEKLLKCCDQDQLRTELKAMIEIPTSPFLQRCYTAFETTNEIFFIVDYMARGDLFSHLGDRIRHTRKGFSEEEASIMLAEIYLGLEHLHKNGFIHRDLKVCNSS